MLQSNCFVGVLRRSCWRWSWSRLLGSLFVTKKITEAWVSIAFAIVARVAIALLVPVSVTNDEQMTFVHGTMLTMIRTSIASYVQAYLPILDTCGLWLSRKI